MKTRKTKLLLLAALLIMAFTLAACDSGNPPAENTSPPPTATPETTPPTTTPDTTPPETAQPTDNGNGEETTNGEEEIDYDNLPPIIPAPVPPPLAEADEVWAGTVIIANNVPEGITSAELADYVTNGTIPSNVTHLYLGRCKISDLTPLSGLTNLRYLDLSQNQISDLTPLAGLMYLGGLQLTGNQITDISPLSGLTNMTLLMLDGNQITSIAPLRGMTNLEYLQLVGNPIYDLTHLSGLTNLVQLYVGDGARVTGDGFENVDLTPLYGLTKLIYLEINTLITREQFDDLQNALPNTDIFAMGRSGRWQ